MAKTTTDLRNSFEAVEGGKFAASCTVNGVFNLHCITRNGAVNVEQKTAGNTYCEVCGWNKPNIDEDIFGGVFPKDVRIICDEVPVECSISVNAD